MCLKLRRSFYTFLVIPAIFTTTTPTRTLTTSIKKSCPALLLEPNWRGGKSHTTAPDPQNATMVAPTAQTSHKTKNSNRPTTDMAEPKSQNATRNQDQGVGAPPRWGVAPSMQDQWTDRWIVPLTDLLDNEVERKTMLGLTLDGSPVVVPTPMTNHSSPAPDSNLILGTIPGAFGSNDDRRKRVGTNHNTPVDRN